MLYEVITLRNVIPPNLARVVGAKLRRMARAQRVELGCGQRCEGPQPAREQLRARVFLELHADFENLDDRWSSYNFV